MPFPGRHVPIDGVFVCRCTKVKDGAVPGPRGGKQWAWLMPDGIHRYCSRDCAKLYEQADAEQESGLAEYEAEQAQRAHGYDDADAA